MNNRPRRYWIVKHGLDSLTALPNYIWRTGERAEPGIFQRVKRGDRWVGFAYTTSDARERPLSLVTGFSECIHESYYGAIPQRALGPDGYRTPRYRNAWMIRGKEYGWQPRAPVGVPPLAKLLDRPLFKQTTLVLIKPEEFEKIRREVRRRELNPKKIPLLGREPRYEQEVVGVVACGHKRLGIEKILRLRTAFPDMTVKLRGKADPVHLEIEVYSKSFLAHCHDEQVRRGCFTEHTDAQPAKAPVGLLCWVDDERRSRPAKCGVRHVFELQQLIRDGKNIRWSR